MVIHKVSFLWIILSLTLQSLYATPSAQQFKLVGYLEICNFNHEKTTYDYLYTHFDQLIEFLQANPAWATKLYSAKERFIRSKDRNYYSTDFFGFYDESEREGRSQISFYYCTHFHKFVCSHYPEFNQIPEIIRFLDACLKAQTPCVNLFDEIALELGLETIFSSDCGHPPILFKVIKYFPSYTTPKPHFDGSAFTLFLDSTDNEALLLSPYKENSAVDDFISPHRMSCLDPNQHSVLLIPGALLSEFGIYPTPHIVKQSGKIRYATVAFAMRPNHIPQKFKFSPLPSFNY